MMCVVLCVLYVAVGVLSAVCAKFRGIFLVGHDLCRVCRVV